MREQYVTGMGVYRPLPVPPLAELEQCKRVPDAVKARRRAKSKRARAARRRSRDT